MRYWTKTYTSSFMLLFFWQLFVLFYAPFIAAQDPQKKDLTESTCFQDIIELDERTTITDSQSNIFVEEILEEEIHPSETLVIKYPKERVFHYAFHSISDYHASIKSHFLPPEVMI